MASISKALYDIRFFVIGFAATGVFFTSVYRSGLANRTLSWTCARTRTERECAQQNARREAKCEEKDERNGARERL